MLDAKDAHEGLQTQIGILKDEKAEKVAEITKLTEQFQNAEIQIDRLSKKEEMNGHLKAEYEAEVQRLKQEQIDMKEQYRNTFDQLTSKEAELRKNEEKL